MDQIKIYLNYIKEIINGEEYLSDRDKFTLILHLCAVSHLIFAGIFLGFGNILMMLYNLLSFLIYESLVTLTKNKQFKLITLAITAEVNVFVLLSTLAYGKGLYFNLFCFLLIPAVFYISNSAKAFKHPFFASIVVTIITMANYIFSAFYENNNYQTLVERYHVLLIITIVLNITVTAFLLGLFCFMFTIEMRNSTATLENRTRQLKQLSSIDPLTKLANRRSMMEKLNISMHLLRKDKKVFSLILGDIDDFKKVNDTYGHDCGDKVLVMVADTISSQMREGDFVCRWGGEEILILVNGNIEAAKSLGDRILNKICASEVNHEGNTVKVTMTFGVAQANESFRIEDFIQQADNRLYYGKTHGKCQVVAEIPNSVNY
ncbi:MAG: GGDEF domain-containing protein [Lachnospiraceae bacterium]|nr:GGDEF domain-containing protein [Lachnospiraceae bacterium]